MPSERIVNFTLGQRRSFWGGDIKAGGASGTGVLHYKRCRKSIPARAKKVSFEIYINLTCSINRKEASVAGGNEVSFECDNEWKTKFHRF